MHGFLWSAVLFLLAAVIAVPISKKLGFGSVLGYLVAGIVIGPAGFQLVTKVEDILHFSEFGVVLLLFLIGLELEPKKLWQLRVPIFGMGGAQVIACFLAFTGIGLLLDYSLPISILLGMGFSLSSTAMVLQILNEKRTLNTESGKGAFSILLFQDIAVIPMIALLPLMGAAAGAGTGGGFLEFAKIVGILSLVLVIGRLVLSRIFSIIAGIHLREVFTALTLLLVTGMALLMQHLELSMGLGAFMAGLLLADSEYRHALETDIEPFKGLLLGLFFISVGMSVPLTVVAENPLLIIGAVGTILVVKFVLHLGIALAFRLPWKQIPFFSLILAQVGEFAFVLFDAAKAIPIINEQERGLLVAISAVSILLTPVAVKLFELFLADRFEGCSVDELEQKVESEEAPVIIAGFGRVGQIVGRFLFANGIRCTVLDYEPDQIELLKKFGFKVFYGDATRLDLLSAAGAKTAKILVVAIDDVESNLKVVDLAREHFPHLKIVCRARNVAHVFELTSRGVDVWERETFDSSLRLGRRVLENLDYHRHHAFGLAQRFWKFDHEMLLNLARERSNEKLRISIAKQARSDIERLFQEEQSRKSQAADGWSEYQRFESETTK
jgi:glutathione-regulated potassium-efflux system ancillary protein KefC